MATQFATLHEIRMRTADARHALLIRFARTTRVFGIQTLRARNHYGPVVRKQWLWLLIATTGTAGIILLLLFQIFGSRLPVKEVAANEANGGAASTDAGTTPEPLLGSSTADLGAADPPSEDFVSATETVPFVVPEQKPEPEKKPALPLGDDVEPPPFIVKDDPEEYPSVAPPEINVVVERTDVRESGPPPDDDTPLEVSSRDALPAMTPGFDSSLAGASDLWKPTSPETADALVRPTLYRDKREGESAEGADQNAGGEIEITSAASAMANLAVTVTKEIAAQGAVDQLLAYDLVVRNQTDKPVPVVIVEERLPSAVQVADVSPAADLDQQTLRWKLQDLEPRAERRLHVELWPTGAGDVETVSVIRPTAAVATTTNVIAPELKLAVELPDEVPQGQTCPIDFTITNVGTVEAPDVVLKSDLPVELSHRKGRALDYKVGTLAPGETRTARLLPRAETLGSALHRASVVALGQTLSETERPVEVVAAAGSWKATEAEREPGGPTPSPAGMPSPKAATSDPPAAPSAKKPAPVPLRLYDNSGWEPCACP